MHNYQALRRHQHVNSTKTPRRMSGDHAAKDGRCFTDDVTLKIGESVVETFDLGASTKVPVKIEKKMSALDRRSIGPLSVMGHCECTITTQK